MSKKTNAVQVKPTKQQVQFMIEQVAMSDAAPEHKVVAIKALQQLETAD